MNGPTIEQNDDEAERAHRRRTFGKTAANTTLSSDSLIEEQQGLQDCLKIYHDNKICQKNAWTLTLIDNLANLLGSHHKTLKNFQIVGSSLEATTKIYGLRVDSVHSDIVRMSSGLGRMKSNLPSANDDDDVDQNDATAENIDQPKIPVKKKRTRKQVSTVTTNKGTLNARLEMIQMPDSLGFQLNSIMGETSSSNKLLLNLLQTKFSDLKLTMDDQFWDSKLYEQITFNENDNYDINDNEYIELPIKLKTDRRHTLRQQMKGYVISNTPMDDDDDDEEQQQQQQAASASFNMSQCLEYAFDMDAEVEPMPADNNYIMDVMDFDAGNDFDDLTQDDRAAITACKGLRRKAEMIEDLRPSDTTKLEYSYRPLDNINQFWAGPSYWKFRKSRKLTLSQQQSIATTEGSTVAPTAHKRKANRPKNEPIKFSTFIESVTEKDADDSDDEIFVSTESRHGQKFKKTNVYKRWDSKKLKLPTDLHIDRSLFNSYVYCPSISIVKKPSETPANDIDADDAFDFDNADDGVPYCTDVPADDDEIVMKEDNVMDHMSDVPDVEIPMLEQIPDSQNNQHEHEISQTYEGAPQLVQKIDIQFARRAKVIDMKQMKTVCLNTITKQCEKTSTRTFNHTNLRHEEKYKEGAASFGIIYNTLPHMLTKTMAENLSPSIAFYSILHLANEHRLRLHKSSKDNDMNIFLIRQLEE
ncbi:condensin complex subunit 2 isoform X2 [Contarinia nasturtii]|uniref:condensin complex subunit 2 isoform X2 n=1 Tax=Contarinia nasturtii TaxID=265458 RepID=UPI0012D3CB50|nr:condensin complex subunit 2 isoform X2 [Contarinia nasturtii]